MAKKTAEDNSQVRRYRYHGELVDCLRSGWSAPTVRAYLLEQHGPEGLPHEKAIQRWRMKYLKSDDIVLPKSVISQKLKGLEYKVDVLGHYSRLIAICEDRVGRGQEMEEKFDGMPMAVNDTVMQTYMQAMKEYVKIAQDLGIMKSPPQSPLVDMRTQNLIASPEVVNAFRETVREIQANEAKALKSGRP